MSGGFFFCAAFPELLVASAVLYEACVKGLRTINPNLVFNSSLPRNNAGKVNVAQEVVKAITEAGFRGDLSYSALMYPNEGDTRNILMWLNQNVKVRAFLLFCFCSYTS